MSDPTAAQIEATVALPTYQVEIMPGTAWLDVSSEVLEVSGESRLSAGSGDGIGFGLVSAPGQTVRVTRELSSYAWDRTPIRVKLGFAGTNPVTFLGVIDGRDREGPSGAWACAGFQELIRVAPELRTPLVRRRPAFTATTVSSVEDPAGGGYAAGMGNRILWHAGGRPLEQAASYPGAVFYYSCEQAILAPAYDWVNGGDLVEELDERARIAGGVVYQDYAGVVRYVEPFSLGGGEATLHYTDAPDAALAANRLLYNERQYGRAREQARGRRTAPEVVRATFVERRLQTTQRIYASDTPRFDGYEDAVIPAGATRTITLDLERPGLIRSARATAGILGTPDAVDAGDLAVTTTTDRAQQAVVTVTNNAADTAVLYRVEVWGRPLVAGDEVTVSYGTASSTRPRVLTIPDSPLLASRGDAARLCHLYHAFYSTPRPPLTLSGCGFDPTVRLGRRVIVTCADLGLDGANYRVVGRREGRTGVEMDLTLAPVDGLPVASQFFTLGQTYSGADERQLSF